MNKRLLIISPYFPPSNAADMQRIRMSLSYYQDFGWQPEIVCVADNFSDINKDPLLLESLPVDIEVHTVGALPKKITSKLGLGSIAIRSLLFYRKKVNQLLKNRKYDLIYFSTCQFPICILGRYWKKKFHIPYVIDMQDPWHSEFNKNRPKNERPPKYWFSYNLDKYLEPFAMKECDGLISVSQTYINDLRSRYPILKEKPASVITFGAFNYDLQVVERNNSIIPIAFDKGHSVFNLVYIGRGGTDMKKALQIIFSAFKRGLTEAFELFSVFRFNFIGTSYAPNEQGKKTVIPVAKEEGVEDFVFEQTNRVSYYSALASLLAADGLIVPGSEDSSYTASKIYPYIICRKPLLGVFHPESSVVQILSECNAGELITFNDDAEVGYLKLASFLEGVKAAKLTETNWQNFEKYTARAMTSRQCDLFKKVMKDQN